MIKEITRVELYTIIMNYSRDAGGTVNENVAISNILLNERIKGLEEVSDIFLLAVDEWVDYVLNRLVQDDVVHVLGSGDDYIVYFVPVLMFWFLRKSWSRADCMSPKKILLPVSG